MDAYMLTQNYYMDANMLKTGTEAYTLKTQIGLFSDPAASLQHLSLGYRSARAT